MAVDSYGFHVDKINNRDRLLCAILGCGVDELVDIDGINMYFEEAVKDCLDETGSLNFNDLMRFIFFHASCRLEKKVRAKIDSSEEEEQKNALEQLDPLNDIDWGVNGSYDTKVFLVKNQKTYTKYLQDELDEFYEDTGYEIMTC